MVDISAGRKRLSGLHKRHELPEFYGCIKRKERNRRRRKAMSGKDKYGSEKTDERTDLSGA